MLRPAWRAGLLAFCFAVPVVSQQAPPRLVRDATIGEGAYPDGFTTIGSVLVAPNGDVYVSQPADNVVLHFTASGRFVRKVGGRGTGPGETERLANAGLVGDTLWTTDLLSGRFNLHSLDGAFLGTVRPPNVPRDTPGGAVSLRPSALLRGDLVLYAGFSSASRVGADRPGPIPISIATRDGAMQHTVASITDAGRATFGVKTANGEAFFSDGALASLIQMHPIVVPGGSGAWLVIANRQECETGAGFSLLRVGLTGDTTWRGQATCPLAPVPPGFVDSVVAHNRDLAVRQMGAVPHLAEPAIRARLGAVPAFSPVRAVMVADDGSIWFQPTTLGTAPQEWIRGDTPSGAAMRIVLPQRAQMRAIVSPNVFWATVLDADDVPSLVRFRVVR